MNEKKAKKLRRVVFGNKAFRGTQEYLALFFDKKAKDIPIDAKTILHYVPFTVILKPGTPHANYRAIKRAWAHGGGR